MLSTLSTQATTALLITSAEKSASQSEPGKRSKKSSAMDLFLISVGDETLLKQPLGSRSKIVEEIHSYRLMMNKYNARHQPSVSSSLQFWRACATTFPNLSTLARKLIATPATSVPSESAFSTSAYLGRKERSRLSSENLAASVFLKVSTVNATVTCIWRLVQRDSSAKRVTVS